MGRFVCAVAAIMLLVTACGPDPVETPAESLAVSTAGRPTVSPTAISTPAGSTSPTASVTTSTPKPIVPAFDPTGLRVGVKVVVDGLTDPVDVTNAGDGSGRLFVVEQAGRIRIVRDGALLARPFLDIADRVGSGGERGLLGLAFHPNYPADPRFVVDYTNRAGNTVIATYRVSGTADVADPASETVLLRIDQPYSNHNGGAVEFGKDGLLYIGMGDGGSAGDPQGNGRKLSTLLAKVLRIDIDTGGAAPYAIPQHNPFVDQTGARPEIWATGLRNPWRIRFDRATGDLWVGDVGQDLWEEIDVARADDGGLDFGWNAMEGFHCFKPATGCRTTGLTLPVAEYPHPAGCAVIGGVVVRSKLAGRLDGGYLFGDACTDTIWAIDPVGAARREPVVVGKAGRSLSSIGEAEDGSVYATSLKGVLLKISAAGS